MLQSPDRSWIEGDVHSTNFIREAINHEAKSVFPRQNTQPNKPHKTQESGYWQSLRIHDFPPNNFAEEREKTSRRMKETIKESPRSPHARKRHITRSLFDTSGIVCLPQTREHKKHKTQNIHSYEQKNNNNDNQNNQNNENNKKHITQGVKSQLVFS
eukprot:gb/GECH01004525.1/.p1 GENE.gb/GECH01004525.1/~~gb/GECH01004525.1/.p1  ORF type:complete len:157 (+),score=47.06 gb/GECH01004525.1/:1-471(+)